MSKITPLFNTNAPDDLQPDHVWTPTFESSQEQRRRKAAEEKQGRKRKHDGQPSTSKDLAPRDPLLNFLSDMANKKMTNFMIQDMYISDDNSSESEPDESNVNVNPIDYFLGQETDQDGGHIHLGPTQSTDDEEPLWQSAERSLQLSGSPVAKRKRRSRPQTISYSSSDEEMITADALEESQLSVVKVISNYCSDSEDDQMITAQDTTFEFDKSLGGSTQSSSHGAIDMPGPPSTFQPRSQSTPVPKAFQDSDVEMEDPAIQEPPSTSQFIPLESGQKSAYNPVAYNQAVPIFSFVTLFDNGLENLQWFISSMNLTQYGMKLMVMENLSHSLASDEVPALKFPEKASFEELLASWAWQQEWLETDIKPVIVKFINQFYQGNSFYLDGINVPISFFNAFLAIPPFKPGSKEMKFMQASLRISKSRLSCKCPKSCYRDKFISNKLLAFLLLQCPSEDHNINDAMTKFCYQSATETCSVCHMTVDVVKHTRFIDLPELLLIGFERTSIDKTTGNPHRNNDPINIGAFLITIPDIQDQHHYYKLIGGIEGFGQEKPLEWKTHLLSEDDAVIMHKSAIDFSKRFRHASNPPISKCQFFMFKKEDKCTNLPPILQLHISVLQLRLEDTTLESSQQQPHQVSHHLQQPHQVSHHLQQPQQLPQPQQQQQQQLPDIPIEVTIMESSRALKKPFIRGNNDNGTQCWAIATCVVLKDIIQFTGRGQPSLNEFGQEVFPTLQRFDDFMFKLGGLKKSYDICEIDPIMQVWSTLLDATEAEINNYFYEEQDPEVFLNAFCPKEFQAGFESFRFMQIEVTETNSRTSCPCTPEIVNKKVGNKSTNFIDRVSCVKTKVPTENQTLSQTIAIAQEESGETKCINIGGHLPIPGELIIDYKGVKRQPVVPVNCNKEIKHSSKTHFVTAPEVLFVSVDRRNDDYVTKNTAEVHFNEVEITLMDKTKVTYVLAAGILHTGPFGRGGHWIACLVSPDGKNVIELSDRQYIKKSKRIGLCSVFAYVRQDFNHPIQPPLVYMESSPSPSRTPESPAGNSSFMQRVLATAKLKTPSPVKNVSSLIVTNISSRLPFLSTEEVGWFIFMEPNQSELSWLYYVFTGLCMALKRLDISIKSPSSSKTILENYLCQIYHAKQADVINFMPLAQELDKLHDNSGLFSDNVEVSKLFSLAAFKTMKVFSANLKPNLSKTRLNPSNLCKACCIKHQEKFTYYTTLHEPPLKLDKPSKLPRKMAKLTLQYLIQNLLHSIKCYHCDECGKLIRFTHETKLTNSSRGIVIHIVKDTKKLKDELPLEVNEEIWFPYMRSELNEEVDGELAAWFVLVGGVRQLTTKKYQLTFRKQNKYYTIFSSNKIRSAQPSDLQFCDLLFYKIKTKEDEVEWNFFASDAESPGDDDGEFDDLSF